MKEIISSISLLLFAYSTQAQLQGIQFIDSLAIRTDPYKTVLMFTEFRATMDDQTGKPYTQRNSYYFDWVHKELRYIEVYNFDNTVKKHKTERAFRKGKQIPSSTHITYIFFKNHLVKASVTPSVSQCAQCYAEYYYVNDILILKKEQNPFAVKRDFTSDAAFYLTRLGINRKPENLMTNK